MSFNSTKKKGESKAWLSDVDPCSVKAYLTRRLKQRNLASLIEDPGKKSAALERLHHAKLIQADVYAWIKRGQLNPWLKEIPLEDRSNVAICNFEEHVQAYLLTIGAGGTTTEFQDIPMWKKEMATVTQVFTTSAKTEKSSMGSPSLRSARRKSLGFPIIRSSPNSSRR